MVEAKLFNIMLSHEEGSQEGLKRSYKRFPKKVSSQSRFGTCQEIASLMETLRIKFT